MTGHEINPVDRTSGESPARGIGQFVRRRPTALGWTGIILFGLLFPLAFVNYEIYVDEGWLGQQVYSLVSHGTVSSEFFRDLPPLDGQVVIYHKLLIWSGAALSLLVGWGLYPLRAVSLVAGLSLIGLMFLARARGAPLKTTLGAILVLVFTPLFFKQMIIFRPEMLVTALGFASFLLLRRGIDRDKTLLVVIAGLLAGLSGTAHAAGLAFAAAGVVVLIWERKYLAGFLFAVCAALAFFPYVSGLMTDRELFMQQAFHNRLISGDLAISWYQPFVNLLEEHKRWFRKPEVIGLSVLFLLALIQMTREDFRRQRIFWIYFVVLAAVLAMAPIPKITRYMLPLAPFMAVTIAERWTQRPAGSNQRRALVRTAFIGWSVLFFGVGISLLTVEALSHKNNQIATNHLMAARMVPGSLVMAPFDFVFDEQPQFTIQSFRGAEKSAGEGRTVQFLERYADSLGVRYLVLSPEEIQDWKLNSGDLSKSFRLYTPLLGSPANSRWLVGRSPDSAAGQSSAYVPRPQAPSSPYTILQRN